MKKQTTIFLSFSALMAIGAMSPNILWHANKPVFRSPSSIQQKDPVNDLVIKSLIEKKEEEKTELDIMLDNIAEDSKPKESPLLSLKDLVPMSVGSDSREVKSVIVECLKESQPKELEVEIKKLMEDKAKIINEIEELKVVKKEKNVTKTDYNQDIFGIMSQLTSLMASQQQQSMAMMTQMFSMFQTQQPKQHSWYSPMSDYMSPYAFNASDMVFPKPNYELLYPMNMGSQIGLTLDYNRAYSAFDRQPAQKMDLDPMFEKNYLGNEASFQPQALQVRPHNGFNFVQPDDAMGMQRIQIK